MSLGHIYVLDATAEPRSIRRRRSGRHAVIAGVDPIALVVPLVEPAISRFRHHQPESVIQEVRRTAPQPSTPSSIAEAQWAICNVTTEVGHELRVDRRQLARRSGMSPAGISARSRDARLFGDHSSQVALSAFPVETTHGQEDIDDRHDDRHHDEGESDPRIDRADDALNQ